MPIRAQLRKAITIMSSVHRWLAVLALCLLSAGCLTTAEQQAKNDGERCVKRGLQPGTKEFDFCLSQIDGDRETRIQQRRQEMLEKSAAPPLMRGQ
jgi:hypothetical protein